MMWMNPFSRHSCCLLQVAIRYHFHIYKDWSRANHIIKVIGWTQMIEATVVIPHRRERAIFTVKKSPDADGHLRPVYPNTWPNRGNSLVTPYHLSAPHDGSVVSPHSFTTVHSMRAGGGTHVSKSLTDVRESLESTETDNRSPAELMFHSSSSSQQTLPNTVVIDKQRHNVSDKA